MIQRKRGKQDLNDVTQKEGAIKLSDNSLGDVSGGGIRDNQVPGAFCGYDARYHVIDDSSGEVVYRTNDLDDAKNYAIENNILTDSVSPFRHRVSPFRRSKFR